MTILGTITALPIKSIKILKDLTYGVSRGICLVELHTTLEASELFSLLSSITNGFIIDDYSVQISYGKRSSSAAQININAVNAASVALAAAQWTNQKDDVPMENKANASVYSSHNIDNASSSSANVIVNGIEFKKYPIPNVATYQYDESSGYYYDSSTGYYYDSNTQYYYDPHSQKYLYWNASYQTYIPVESDGSTSNSTKTEDDKKEKPKDKQDKVKVAKKIAKEMEKWAKTLNQKKEVAKTTNSYVEINSQFERNTAATPTADAAYSVFDKTQSKDYSYLINQQTKVENVSTLSLEVNKPYEDPMEIVLEEERKLTDWDKLACLLCKRQFQSRELLSKHQQFSELHKVRLD